MNVIKNGKSSHKSGLSASSSRTFSLSVGGPGEKKQRNFSTNNFRLFIKARKHYLLLKRKFTGDHIL